MGFSGLEQDGPHVEETRVNNPSYELAATPGVGRVFDCGNCSCIHLQVGPVSLALTRPGYLQLVEMLNRSAANFELLMEERESGD
jgi:hypothetical protein